MQSNANAPHGTLFSLSPPVVPEEMTPERQYIIAVQTSDRSVRFVGPFSPLPDTEGSPGHNFIHKEFEFWKCLLPQKESELTQVMIPKEGIGQFFNVHYTLHEYGQRAKAFIARTTLRDECMA